MRISRIETFPVTVPVDRRVGRPEETKGFRFESHLLLILIHTDTGPEGVGEVTASPDWSGETSLGAKHQRKGDVHPRFDEAGGYQTTGLP